MDGFSAAEHRWRTVLCQGRPLALRAARSNVQLTIDTLRSGSPILSDLEKKGQIKIVGSMYDLSNGVVTFAG